MGVRLLYIDGLESESKLQNVSLIVCVCACASLCNTLRQTNSCHLVPPDPPAARSLDRRAMLKLGSFLGGGARIALTGTTLLQVIHSVR